MNKERRKAINDLIDTAESIKARIDTVSADDKEGIGEITSEIESLVSDIEYIRDEEQEYYDNMHENFQQGDRGQNAEAAVSALEQAIDNANDAATELTDGPSDDDNTDVGVRAMELLDDAVSSLDEATA